MKYYNIINIIINIIEIMMNKLIITINNYEEEIETIKNWIIQNDSFSSIIFILNMNILFNEINKFWENILHIFYMNELKIVIRILKEIEIIYIKIKEVYSTFLMNMNMNKYLLLNNIKYEIQESLTNITIINTNNQYKYFIIELSKFQQINNLIK